jgi:hypothetical protein
MCPIKINSSKKPKNQNMLFFALQTFPVYPFQKDSITINPYLTPFKYLMDASNVF